MTWVFRINFAMPPPRPEALIADNLWTSLAPLVNFPVELAMLALMELMLL